MFAHLFVFLPAMEDVRVVVTRKLSAAVFLLFSGGDKVGAWVNEE
jgi:hypothetical protein